MTGFFSHSTKIRGMLERIRLRRLEGIRLYR